MTLVGILIGFAVLSLVGYLYKVRIRSKLSRGLGRNAEDHELTSLNSWMEASPDKQKNYKKYTPAKSSPATPDADAAVENDPN